MILFIRDKKNNTILDLDVYVSSESGLIDISATVVIEHYSRFLLSSPEDRREEIISDFDELQEIRGWLHESYFLNRKNCEKEYDRLLEVLRKMIKEFAHKHGLGYVED